MGSVSENGEWLKIGKPKKNMFSRGGSKKEQWFLVRKRKRTVVTSWKAKSNSGTGKQKGTVVLGSKKEQWLLVGKQKGTVVLGSNKGTVVTNYKMKNNSGY